MAQYDFFIAGRWRNKDAIKPVLDAVRAAGKTAYCFIENDYVGEKIEMPLDVDPETFMAEMERLAPDDEFIDRVFKRDMAAQRIADNFLLVLPAGISGHIESGAAYGFGKKCYAVGIPEKTETLYRIFDEIFADINALKAWLASW
jgi:hypothetical protein